MDCIFCKIIKGEIPSAKVYEDEKSLAFLDITPINFGHTLVVPKEHYLNIYDIPAETFAHLAKIAQKVAIALKSLKNDGVNIGMNNELAAGQLVPHAHIHVMPRLVNDGFEMWHSKKSYQGDEMSKIAESIKNKVIN
jgi:histidine triad (HIT) family protein